jgi:hypothetical protein
VSGKRFVGPCSHEWEHVLSTFAMCTVKGCDGKAAPASKTACKCGSTNVEPFSAPPIVPDGSFHCWTCGRVWFAGF